MLTNKFALYHPVVTAVYFFSILVFTMFSNHPILLCLTLLGAICFRAMLEGMPLFWKNLGVYIPIFLLLALINPLFSHNGVTVLFFFNGNPITLEAFLYGMDIAAMLVAVLYWFACFQVIMTSDKVLFLLGKISPKLSIVLASVFRFIPLFQKQAKKIWQTQRTMGLFVSESWIDRGKSILRVFSALITWSLENAIDTGASMKARGYGLKGRTYFSLYHFEKSDVRLLILIFLLDGIVLFFMSIGKLSFVFYPKLSVFYFEIENVIVYAAFAILAFLPFILEGKEHLKWHYYKSKI